MSLRRFFSFISSSGSSKQTSRSSSKKSSSYSGSKKSSLSSTDESTRGSANGATSPLLKNNLDGYTEEELKEFRQVFNMFDTDRSGAIGLDELEAAVVRLGLEQTKEELNRIIDDVDQRGNHEIDFDEFCKVMKRLYNKKSSWEDVTQQCFEIFDRGSGTITMEDFRKILRDLGDFHDNILIEEIFNENDIDGNGVIDRQEFAHLIRNYMLDEDIE